MTGSSAKCGSHASIEANDLGGHVTHMGNNRLPKKVLYSEFEKDSRKVACSKLSYKNCLDQQ